MRIVLWDVDGTLLLNGGRAGKLYDDAIAAVTGVQPAGERQGEHGKTDAQIITERLRTSSLDPALLPVVAAKLDELSEAGNAGPWARRTAPGVDAALDAVAGAGWTNGILTGNSPARVRYKFAGAGLDAGRFDWRHSYFGDRALTREAITTAARADLGPDAIAVILGDTPSDAAAADAAGFPFLAVATGVYSEAVLAGTSAVVVVPDLEQGRAAVLDALGGVAQAPTSAAR
jgi:phosphoglycolate phosphatase-like HAD superfamily hydrolase